MAANLKSSGAIANLLGKRLRNRTSSTSTATRRHLSNATPASTFTTRSAHASAYDKNQDEDAHPSVVPDEVIQPQSDKYWAPHPQTGVFSPATEHNPSGGGRGGGEQGSHSSTMEEKAWFRPTNIEDLEKPHHG